MLSFAFILLDQVPAPYVRYVSVKFLVILGFRPLVQLTLGVYSCIIICTEGGGVYVYMILFTGGCKPYIWLFGEKLSSRVAEKGGNSKLQLLPVCAPVVKNLRKPQLQENIES